MTKYVNKLVGQSITVDLSLLNDTPRVYGLYNRGGIERVRKYSKPIKNGLNEFDLFQRRLKRFTDLNESMYGGNK